MDEARGREDHMFDRLARWAGRGTSRRDVMKVAGAGALAYFFLPLRPDSSFAQTGRCDACFDTYEGCMRPKRDEMERKFKAETGDFDVKDSEASAMQLFVKYGTGSKASGISKIQDGEFGATLGSMTLYFLRYRRAREECREKERKCLEQNPPCGRCQECVNGGCKTCGQVCKLCDQDTGKCATYLCRSDQVCCEGRCVPRTQGCCPEGTSVCTAGGDVNCCYPGQTCCATRDRALCCGGSVSACCHSTSYGQQYADCYDPSTQACCPSGGVYAIECTHCCQ
jgi:hypothetical protein